MEPKRTIFYKSLPMAYLYLLQVKTASWNISFIFFTLILTLMAVIGKVVECGAGYALFRRNFWESAIIGFGMNGRGAVEIVVASVILKLR